MFVFSAREYGLDMVMIYGFSSKCLVPVGFCLCWGKTKGHIGDRVMTWRRHRLTWQVMASGEEIIPRQILICADGYPNKSVSGGLCGVWDAGLTLKEHFVFESSLCFTALPATKRYSPHKEYIMRTVKGLTEALRQQQPCGQRHPLHGHRAHSRWTDIEAIPW